jgi:dipeptidyl aminopeptidase/acylaminoacyl peptidase
LQLVDASEDQSKLLLLAANESDPGIYYVFDRAANRLDTFLPVRKPLEGVELATVKPVTYTAGDGVTIHASLLLPPRKENAKGLPAIVLSDVGTSGRDAQGFDWLAQFFANRGYAVLQPGQRGAGGFGEMWSLTAYSSWQVAAGDVVAGARWLVSSGVADPKKLATLGWSSGGYASLQAAVVEPDLFKAVIAIAPLTSLGTLQATHRFFPDASTVNTFVGSGSSSAHDGSPVERAVAFKSPVLLFHGAQDVFMNVEESRNLDARLKSAGKQHELVVWDTLDHQLEDSDARAELLRKSEALLHSAGL